MSSTPVPIWRATLLALVLLGTGGIVRGDRLHLESGGHIDVETWWFDGDWVRYEGPAGTVGIPRAMVVRIESVTTQPTRTQPTASTASSTPSTPQRRPLDELRKMVEEANTALERRDFERASGLYLEILGDAPDLAVARVGYAVSEIALGRDGVALSVVLDGLARDPEQAELRELLGDLRDREERVEDALREWKEAFRISPTDRVREKILKAERELNVGRDYDFAATSHFNLRYDGEVARQLIDELMDYLEEQYAELGRTFRHAPPQPITVQLYPKRQFREVTQSPEWVGGVYDGKIRVPLGGLNRLNPRARGVLLHEMTHAFVHSKTRGQCPRWLHEGLAQIMDGSRLSRADRLEVARMLESVDPTEWERQQFSYPAALSLTRFLEERRGFEGLTWVLDELGEGQSLDQALRRTYGLDYASLCRRWKESSLEPGE